MQRKLDTFCADFVPYLQSNKQVTSMSDLQEEPKVQEEPKSMPSATSQGVPPHCGGSAAGTDPQPIPLFGLELKDLQAFGVVAYTA
jgi:hypothetical protein